MHAPHAEISCPFFIKTSHFMTRSIDTFDENVPYVPQFTTDSKHKLPVAPHPLARNFSPAALNMVFTPAFTYSWTDEGLPYSATVLDFLNGKVTEWLNVFMHIERRRAASDAPIPARRANSFKYVTAHGIQHRWVRPRGDENIRAPNELSLATNVPPWAQRSYAGPATSTPCGSHETA